MKRIFIAFTGPKIRQQRRFRIAPNFESWNLDKFSLDSFVPCIKKVIPRVNDNVLGNYKRDEKNRDVHFPFAITEKEFRKCSWGLLLPDNIPNTSISGYTEISFLLNLYASKFLYPAFYVSNFGIERLKHSKDVFLYFHGQNQSKIFKNEKFVKFFKKLLPQSVYGAWQRDRCEKWNKEDWRLFVASLLYSELRKYEGEKKPITWQREAADMITILESLFTAGDSISEEIGYRLRKRIAVLVGFRFPDIEKDVKMLYRERSKFIHGSFFAEVGKEAKNKNSVVALPIPDFDFLYKHKEYVRFALIAYLNLASALPHRFKKVIDVLEEAIIDMTLREKVVHCTKDIFDVLG